MYRDVGGLNKIFLFLRIAGVWNLPQEILHVCFIGFPRYLENVEGFRLSVLPNKGAVRVWKGDEASSHDQKRNGVSG